MAAIRNQARTDARAHLAHVVQVHGVRPHRHLALVGVVHVRLTGVCTLQLVPVLAHLGAPLNTNAATVKRPHGRRGLWSSGVEGQPHASTRQSNGVLMAPPIMGAWPHGPRAQQR